MNTNYYDLLKLTPNAGNQEIRDAYLSLIRRYHPDLGGDPRTAAELNIAYETLTDPVLRREYDEKLSRKGWLASLLDRSEKDESNPRRIACLRCTAVNAVPYGQSAPRCRLCGAALPVADIESRRKMRYPFQADLTLKGIDDDAPKQGKAIDLSDSGIRVISFEPIDSKESLFILANEFKAAGRVVWVNEKKLLFRQAYEMGISFEDFTSWNHSFIVRATA